MAKPPIGPILAALAIPIAVMAHAATWIQPARPLSRDELLELAVSESDAIGVGRVAGVHDTLANVVNGVGIPVRSMTVEISEWLLGRPGTSAIEVCVPSADSSPLFSDILLTQGLSDRQAVFFLDRAGAGWSLRAYPDPPAVQFLESRSAALSVSDLRRAIARQSPDSLMARADLIVVGSRGEQASRCPSGALERECVTVRVKNVLAGGPAPDSLRAYSVMMGHIPAGDALYLLKRMPVGDFETVGFRSGSLSIKSGRVDQWGLTLDQVRARVLATRASTQRAKPR